jgi:hypothetical protein
LMKHGSHSPHDGSVRMGCPALLMGELMMMSHRGFAPTPGHAAGKHQCDWRTLVVLLHFVYVPHIPEHSSSNRFMIPRSCSVRKSTVAKGRADL